MILNLDLKTENKNLDSKFFTFYKRVRNNSFNY